MEIITVKHGDRLLSVGDIVKVKYYPIVDDEEDKNNPIEEEVLIQSFQPTEDCDVKIVGINKDGKDSKENYFFDDNLI